LTDERKRSFIINAIFFTIITLLVYAVFKYLFAWLFPFVIGGIVAVALQRPIDWLTKNTKLSRTVWSLLLVVVSFLILAVVIFFAASQLFAELISFFKTLPSYVPDLSNWLSGVGDSLKDAMKEMPEDLVNGITNSLVSAPETVANNLAAWGGGLAGSVVLSLPDILISTIITIVATCFITKDYHVIASFFQRQIKPQRWEVLVEAKNHFITNTLKMLRGYVLIMFITFVELALGLSILRIKYAMVIAMLVALVDIMPVLGTGTVMLPWGIIAIAMGDYKMGTGVLVIYGVVTVVRYMIEPRVIGKQVGLEPVVTLFALYLGLRLFGVVGLFGLPISLIIVKNLQDSGRFKIWK